MKKHLGSDGSSSDIGRGHHRAYRFSLAETAQHQSQIAQAEQTFLKYIEGGGKGTLDITSYSLLGVSWTELVYHGAASHALR